MGWFRTFIIRTSRKSCEERMGGQGLRCAPRPPRMGRGDGAGGGAGHKGGGRGGKITFCRLEELSCVLSMIFTAT